jgi:Spy/CpxP family protein refolding chaperone
LQSPKQTLLKGDKNMMKKTVITMVVAGLVVFAASYVLAGGPGFGPGQGRGGCGGFWGVQNLTPEQQTKLQELRQKHYTQVNPLRERMFALRQELRTLWADPNADAQAIKAKESEMNSLRDQMRDQAVQLKLDARNILTPEQISSLGAACGGPGRGFGRGPF